MAGPLRPVPLSLRLHDRTLTTTGRPLVMGVLNVTPDSFSDGGRHLALDAAAAQAYRLLGEGADILDVGGESTRPGAAPVPPVEERARIMPVLGSLRDAGFPLPVSVDTRHAETARAALDAGAHLVNDVSALADPAMAGTVVSYRAPIVLMHMRGTPGTMQGLARYDEVVAEVKAELASVRDRALAAGIPRGSIVLDPGLGFGKRTGAGIEDNCDLLSHLPAFHDLGHPLLVGASRKRFIGSLTGAPVDDRLPGSLAAALAALWGGAQIVRVHDVAATVQAFEVAAALDPSEWATSWRRLAGPAPHPHLQKP